MRLAVAVVAGACSLIVLRAQEQNVFRAGTLIVPVDVRVLDGKGKPVTDLKESDFTIYEDGVRQNIRQFAVQAVTPTSADAGGGLLRRTTQATAALVPQNRRLFLIVFGRGRLEEVSKTLPALQSFVRTRLYPQDQIAIMAWNRATDFTTDHEQAARVLDRFRAKHRDVEFELQLYFSGLSGLYAGRAIPPKIQAKIDDVFNESGGAGSRTVLPTASTREIESANQRISDQLLRTSEIEAGGQLFKAFGTDIALSELITGTSMASDFDSYVALSRQTLQDVGNIYAGIDYLRFIDGEKHLIFVTEQGFQLPNGDNDRDIGKLAADARVALDTIQTGGVASEMVGDSVVVRNGFALSALRTISEASGGQVSVSRYGDEAIDRVAHSTEFGYLIAYAPTNSRLDGSFRDIKVRVNRPGVEVSFRSGYFARPSEPFDPRVSLATTRMVAAINSREEIGDLKISFDVTNVKTFTDRIARVDITIKADRIVFAKVGPDRVAAISYSVICADQNGRKLGEVWTTSDLRVSEESYPDVRRNGLKLSVPVTVSLQPALVSVVVYDYGCGIL